MNILTRLDAVIGNRVRYVRNGKTYYRALPGKAKKEPKRNRRRKAGKEDKSVRKSKKGRVGVATAIALSVLGTGAVGTAVALGVGSSKKDKPSSSASVSPPSSDFPNAPNPPKPDIPRKNPLLGEDLALPAARKRRKNQTQEINSNDPWDRQPDEAIIVKGKQKKSRPQLMPDIGYELGYEGSETSLVPERKSKTPTKRQRSGDPYPKRSPKDPEVQAYQRDLHRIGKNKDIDAFERDLQVFEAYQQHFPDEANMLKFYEVSRAIAEPLQRDSKKGRPLKKYSGVIEFVNRNATSAYQKSPTGYSDYMTIDPSIDSVGKYRQFLERISKASRQPTAKVYDRLERNYAIGYENQGLDKTEARQRSQEVVHRIFGDIESHKQDLDKAIQERINLIDQGRIIYRPNKKGKGGNFYDTGVESVKPSQVIKSAQNLLEVLQRPEMQRERLQKAFQEGLTEGVERRMVKNTLIEATKGVFDSELIDLTMDILSDVDREAIRVKSMGKNVTDIPDIIKEAIEEYGDRPMGRRESMIAMRNLLTRTEDHTLEAQVKALARDPERATSILGHIDRSVRLRIAQMIERPEGGWLVRRELVDRLLDPFGSKYDIERSLHLARLRGRVKTPVYEYLREKLKVKNPFSMRTRMEIEKARRLQGGRWQDPHNIWKKDSLYFDSLLWVLAG